MRLIEIKELKGKIILASGLHIGAGDLDMRIGGVDNQVVRQAHTGLPYIPGSSIKGKLRSLLEMKSGLAGENNGAAVSFSTLKKIAAHGGDVADCRKILALFGCSGAETDENYDIGPTRASFADCPVDEDWHSEAKARNLPLTEIKAETAIDRIRGTAKQGSLRFTERVPAGVEFAFSISLKVFEEDDDLLEFLLKGLKLLEKDALGGSGSRGYGRVRIEFNDQELKDRFAALEAL